MRFPKRIQPLIDDGLVDEVLHQLMSGKEATVYVVRCGNEIRCAKIYKEAYKRSFKKAVQYREGRKQQDSLSQCRDREGPGARRRFRRRVAPPGSGGSALVGSRLGSQDFRLGSLRHRTPPFVLPRPAGRRPRNVQQSPVSLLYLRAL